jgi:hypothetical protein
MSASDSYALWCFQGSKDKGISMQFNERGEQVSERLDTEPTKKHLAETIAGGARIYSTYPSEITALLAEIDRLREIENHLCVVAKGDENGKMVFSHYVDDREPEHRKKFDEIVKRGFEKYDKAYRDKRMNDDQMSYDNGEPNITAG